MLRLTLHPFDLATNKMLAFDDPAPLADLARQWHAALERAEVMMASLPATHAGEAVLTADARLFRGRADELGRAVVEGRVLFHAGGSAAPCYG